MLGEEGGLFDVGFSFLLLCLLADSGLNCPGVLAFVLLGLSLLLGPHWTVLQGVLLYSGAIVDPLIEV